MSVNAIHTINLYNKLEKYLRHLTEETLSAFWKFRLNILMIRFIKSGASLPILKRVVVKILRVRFISVYLSQRLLSNLNSQSAILNAGEMRNVSVKISDFTSANSIVSAFLSSNRTTASGALK